MNIVILRGVLSSAPRVRELPSGSEIWSYEVTTGNGDERRQSSPVSWLDPARPPKLSIGDEVVVVGSVRRRFFRTPSGSASRTEVVANVVGRAGSARVVKAASQAIDRAASEAAK